MEIHNPSYVERPLCVSQERKNVSKMCPKCVHFHSARSFEAFDKLQ